MTVDKDKLKALAEAAIEGPWHLQEEHESSSFQGYMVVDPWRCLVADFGTSNQEAKNAEFIAAANPAAVLTLLAEIDQLKVESEALRKDKDRLDALEASGWDIRNSSSPMADTGDYNQSIEIVGRWMDKPFERVVGENYNENLRAAIDQAMTADAYPPSRPEYKDHDELEGVQ